MTNNEKKTQRKLWSVHVLLALFIIVLIGVLAFDVGAGLATRMRDVGEYDIHVIYCKPDGDVVETVAQNVRQDSAGRTVQIYLEDSTLMVPVNDFVVWRDKPGRFDKYGGEPGEIMLTMPDGSTTIVTGYASAVDPGFTNPGKYLLTAPIYAVETAEREYYLSGENLFAQELK